MTQVEIRWYAGAGEAAGTPSSMVQVQEGASVAEVLSLGVGDNEALASVVEVASLLAGGVRVADRQAPLTATRLDVLPPFAGG